MRTALLAVVVACSPRAHAPMRDAPAEPAPLTYVERCPGVDAVWTGERAGGYDHFTTLTLHIAGAPRPWTSDLEDLTAEGRTTQIFSPDCRHVLLLQSREGPYHIVRTARLAAYARGAPPDYELAGEPIGDGISGHGVFHDGRWESNTEVAYEWGCCDPPITSHFVLPKRDR